MLWLNAIYLFPNWAAVITGIEHILEAPISLVLDSDAKERIRNSSIT